MGERDARAQDGQIQVQSDRGGARQQGRAHCLRADDEGRPIRRSAGRGLNERSYSIGSFRRRGDQHRGRLRSDVNQRKRLGSPNTGQRQYERERMMGRRATRTNHQGQRMPSPPRQQAVDMTAPETFTTASKQPLTKGRRPDMTAPETFTTASKQPLTKGRRPDMTAPETFTTASKQPLTKGRRPDMAGVCALRPSWVAP